MMATITRSKGLWSKLKAQTNRFRREEDGALIIFSLYAVAVMIMIGGIAVDVMVTEEKRTKLQYTIDGAVLASADLEQELGAGEIMEGHFRAAGFDDVQVIFTKNGVAQPAIGPADAELTVILDMTQGLNFRRVEASASYAVDTLFMHWLGIGYLQAPATGVAEERITDIEISLVLDMSGSMSEASASGDTKLKELKEAARDFFDSVVVNQPDTPGLISASIIPYNQTVVAGSDLLDELNANGGMIAITSPETNPQGLTQVPSQHNFASCIDFTDSDFLTTRVDSSTPLSRKPHYYWIDIDFKRPSSSQRECDDSRTAIMLHQTDPEKLKTHLNTMYAGGNTAIDVGMKWGVAAIDPGLRTAVTNLSATPALPSEVANRPADYWDPTSSTDPQNETLKVIVLMTDGQNTNQYTLRQDETVWPNINFYNDKTDVWTFTDAAWATRFNRWDSAIGRRLDWHDRYIVKIPENDISRRWFRPGDPTTSSDDRWYHRDATNGVGFDQLDWITLFERFSYVDAAEFFWNDARRDSSGNRSDSELRNKVRNAEKKLRDNAAANARLQEICTAAKAEHVVIYTVGFEATTDGVKQLKECATADGYYFDVAGDEIGNAFQAIANQINQLKLTQ